MSISCELARQDVKDRETAEMAVFQLLERPPEHDARRRAVAVDERRPGFRIGRQLRADDRNDRRDAGACGEENIVPARADVRGEPPLGRGDVDTRALPQQFVDEARKASAVDLPHRDPQFPLVDAGADRIGPPAFLAVDRRPHGQVLAGPEREFVAKLLRHGEGDRHAVGRLLPAIDDFERVEPAQAGLKRI